MQSRDLLQIYQVRLSIAARFPGSLHARSSVRCSVLSVTVVNLQNNLLR